MAIRTIHIGEKTVDLLATGATPIFYKEFFKSDFLESINSTVNENGEGIFTVELLGQLAFIMAKQAEGCGFDEMGKITRANYVDWLNRFEFSAFMDAGADILSVLQAQQDTKIELKKTTDKE